MVGGGAGEGDGGAPEGAQSCQDREVPGLWPGWRGQDPITSTGDSVGPGYRRGLGEKGEERDEVSVRGSDGASWHPG